MTDFTAFPIANVTIPSLPDLGGVTDATMLVGERAGTGRFAATGLRDYVMTTVAAYVPTVTAGYLPLSGGTLTGNLSVSDTLFFGASSMSLSTNPDYSIWTLDSGNYEIIYGRHTGVLQYRGLSGVGLWSVDASGNSTVAGNLSMLDTLYFTNSGMSLNAGGNFSIWTLDSTNYEIIYTRATGLLQYRGAGGIELWSVEASAGNMKSKGSYTVGGQGIVYSGVPSNNHLHAFGWTPDARLIVFVDGINEGAVAMASSVVELEARIDELRARIAGLERDRAELQETLSTRIAALEARMGTGTAD